LPSPALISTVSPSGENSTSDTSPCIIRRWVSTIVSPTSAATRTCPPSVERTERFGTTRVAPSGETAMRLASMKSCQMSKPASSTQPAPARVRSLRSLGSMGANTVCPPSRTARCSPGSTASDYARRTFR
jgi:hypothetical protein